MSSLLYSKRHNSRLGRNRRKRPKTYRTEEAAKKAAKEKGLKVEKLSDNKFRLV